MSMPTIRVTRSPMSRRSGRMIQCATLALSDSAAQARADRLFVIAPNPSEQGRRNQVAMWRRNWADQARRLVWC